MTNQLIMTSQKKIITFFFLSITTGMFLLGIDTLNFFPNGSVAQSLRPEIVASQVYQTLTNFPLANQYLSQTSGSIDSENTLILRLIRYHQYIKRRPLSYRFDWKLTLADYLGYNETIIPEQYPGRTLFTVNPLEDDLQIINSLTRQEREELITVLVNIYNPQRNNQNHNSSPQHEQNNPTLPSLPSSGAADLLRF